MNKFDSILSAISSDTKYDASMLDTETYGLHRGAPVWAISLVFFNWTNDETHSVGIVLDPAYQTGPLKMKSDTRFWDGIDPDGSLRVTIKESLAFNADTYFRLDWSDVIDCRNIMKHLFNKLLRDPEKKGAIIANDIDFDKVMLEMLYDKANYTDPGYPWHYRAFMSLPTIIALAKEKTGIDYKKAYIKNVRAATHNPLLDCMDQIAYTKQAYQSLVFLPNLAEEFD